MAVKRAVFSSAYAGMTLVQTKNFPMNIVYFSCLEYCIWIARKTNNKKAKGDKIKIWPALNLAVEIEKKK